MKNYGNCILVVFGASGDLARRKLVPALFDLHRQKLLPEKFAVLGVGRTKLSDAAFRDSLRANLDSFQAPADSEQTHEFLKMLNYLTLDTQNGEDYSRLKARLEALDRESQTGGNYIYYLAIAPSMNEVVARNLGAHDLQREDSGRSCWRRIIVEKPFGYDLASALKLNEQLMEIFQEKQVYRIDHYLGKETVQNILVFRFSNGIFEPLWNRNYIDYVEITAAESIGVENRGGYYDKAGALRDMVQNHLMQVLGIIALEPPSSFHADTVRNEVVKALESLRPISLEEVESCVVRGQYTGSVIKGQKVRGYREENDIPSDSRTETYVAMKVFIENWRWGGIPFYIRAGKRLPTRVTEAVIHFKPTPHVLFSKGQPGHPPLNQLILRIQPDEGILLKFGMKLPGAGFRVKNVSMDFHYSDLSDTRVPEAYERLLLDCMMGDATLYARRDAVEACWRFVDPVLRAWDSNPESKVYGYSAGVWGPQQANALFHGRSPGWRYPCKNLVDDGAFCEL